MAVPFKGFYSTDWHFAAKNPSSRIDYYPETIARKIENFFDVGNDMGCDCFLVPGDFVDSSFLTPKYVIALGKLIQRKLDESGKKLYGVLGNHDIMAYDPGSITSTAFGVFLAFCDSLILLSKTPWRANYHGRDILLSGISSYSQIDKHILDDEGKIVAHRSRDWVVEEATREPRIHMAHGFLSPTAILEDIPHTVINEMRHTKATVTLGSHEHTGFPVTKLDNGLAYNVGALGRIFASHVEMNRMPKYAMVTIYPDGTPEITPVMCPIAEPGDQVMDRTKLDEKKAREVLLAQARGNVQDLVRELNIGSVDLRLIVGKFEGKVRPAVMNEAKKRLGI